MSGANHTDTNSGVDTAPFGEQNNTFVALHSTNDRDNNTSVTLNLRQEQQQSKLDGVERARPTSGSSREVTVHGTRPTSRRPIQKEQGKYSESGLTNKPSPPFPVQKKSFPENEQGAKSKKNVAKAVDLPREQRINNIVKIPGVSHTPRPGSSVPVGSPTGSARVDTPMGLDDGHAFSLVRRRQSRTAGLAMRPVTSFRHPQSDKSSQVSSDSKSRIMRWFMKRNSFSLRCWMLSPLVVILVSVTLVTMALAFISSQQSSQDVFLSLHDVVVANMKVSVGRLTLAKMERMVVATGKIYFSNNTVINGLTDRLMPLEDGMMSHLCAILRDMDSGKTVASLGAVSLTRQQAAICTLSHERPDAFLGVQSRFGIIKAYHRINPTTLEYESSRVPLPISNELSIREFTASQHFDKVIKIWNDTLGEKRVMKPAQYWVTPRRPPTYISFVYPFFESYSNGSTGIGYIFATMSSGDLKGIHGYNATDSGIRVMLVDPNVTEERLLVLANSWGQPLSNVTSVWWAVARGEPVRYMYVDEVADPLMCEALKYVDLRAVVSRKREQNSTFLYDGFDGRVTAEHIVTETGVDFLLVVVTSRSYYLGSVLAYHAIAILVGIIVLLVVTVACVAFVELCLLAPLRDIRSELKLALSGAPLGSEKRRRSVLREVGELGDVCITLRRHLDKVRSFMPHRLLTGDDVAKSGTIVTGGSAYDVVPCGGQSSEELKRVACSVAYVYYTPRTACNPTNTVVGLIMQVVVGIATDCGGCFEVQRPDYCVISFGVRSGDKDFAAEAAQAVEFARRLREVLTTRSELAGLYWVIVETGAFLSGIISGGGRSHFVLLCRNLHHRLGDFLPHVGVVAAVTEETALLVRGRCRLLPFETVYLEETGEEQVKLHEVLGGDTGAKAWKDYECCYSEAYDMMERGDYASALRWWDKAGAVEQDDLAGEPLSYRSSQAERLRCECVRRSKRGDTAPFARRPHPMNNEGDEFARGTDASTDSVGDRVIVSSSSLTESLHEDLVVDQSLSDVVSRELTTGCLPRQFKDHLGNKWRRSLKPIEGAATDITPVYMAISATGTLAVLKVCPLTEAAGRLSRAEIETALKELLCLDVNESLVQYLSYCYLPPRHVLLLTQYAPGGTLRELKARYGRQLPLMVVRRNVASILRGLAHLHSRGLVHGRLSPENVMVGVEGRCRVKGMLLGAAAIIVHHESFYMSPEVAAGGPRTAASDMYALGLLLLSMLTDSHPWQWVAHVAVNRSRNALDSLLADIPAFRKALQDGLLEPVPPPAGVDSTLQGVLKACLGASPENRSTAKEILGTLCVSQE